MTDALVAEIYRGPHGPRIGAFFDYDGTVIDGYSASAFYEHRLRRLEIGPVEGVRTLISALRRGADGEQFEQLLSMALEAWTGRSVEELDELGSRIFAQQIASTVHPEAWSLIRAHERMGHTVVLASSATRFQVGPAARELGVEHVLCTPLEAEDGHLTGRTAGPTLWGAGKARAASAFALEHEIDLEQSYAYANGDEDVPFLELVGRPRPVNPQPELARAAAERGWPVRRFRSRGRPGPLTLARTAATYGGMLSSFATGLTVGLLNRSRRQAVELTMSLGSDLGLALAGVNVRVVRGEEHLWAHRPAVFIINHQSPLDVLIGCKLLRGGFTGVVKKEAANSPGFGQFFRLAEVAFIDRADSAKARAALAPAVERLRDGVSLAIAPEGTRSITPRLGPFKKGAFRVAMEAGVPVVPIVIRNAGEVMWRNAKTIRSGTVEVVVLPPVDVGDWSLEELEERIEEVRRLYMDTLDRWPGLLALPRPEEALA